MSDPNDILGFGSPDATLFPMLAQLEAIANTSGELSNHLIDSFGRELETVTKTEQIATNKILTPIVEGTVAVADDVDALSRQLTDHLAYSLGQATELTHQLDSKARTHLSRAPIEGSVTQVDLSPVSAESTIGGTTPSGGGFGAAPQATQIGAGEDIAVDVPPGGEGSAPPVFPPRPTRPLPGSPIPQLERPIVCADGSIALPEDCPSPIPPPPPPVTPPQICPAGTYWDQQEQRCVPDPFYQQATSCPPPVVNCPDPPDVNVVVQSPSPVDPQNQQQPVEVVYPVAPPPEILEGDNFCGIHAYEIREEIDSGGTWFALDRPIVSMLYGPNFSIDAAILQQDAIANRPWSVFPIDKVTAQIKRDWLRFVKRWNDLVVAFSRASGCTSPIFLGAVLWRGILSTVSILFSGAVEKLDRILKYKTDSRCPVEFPNYDEATEAYIRGTIDEHTYRIWLEQNNHCWEPWQKMTEARTNRVEPLMALQLLKRGFIDEAEFERQVRKAGFTEDKYTDAFRNLGDFVPPITDLVRFMVRDVEDEDLVERFGLTDEFEDKWRGASREWGEQQGITQEAAESYWKAHWRIPSATQLYDMFHRTRHLPDDDPLKTSLNDVETALKQDDMLPYWVPKLINSTYRLLSRVDARRAYETGAIDDEQLRILFTKLGYEESAIDALLRWARINKINVVLNRPEVKLFRDGLYDEAKVRAVLAETKLSDAEISHVIELASLQQRKQYMSRCVNAIRERYLTGELSRLQARIALEDFGLSPLATINTMDAFDCERTASGRQPPTSMLCQWLGDGSITPQELIDRLVKIGWSQDDAFRILGNCTRGIAQKTAREAERLAKEQQRAEEKAQRERQAEERQRERARQNAAKQLQKAERLKSNRDKLIQRTIARFSESAELDLDTATACVLSLERQLAADTLLGIDERIQTVVLTVEKIKPTTCEELKASAQILADALLEFGQITDDFIYANFPNVIQEVRTNEESAG